MAKNVAEQRKWKLRGGEAVKVVKHRVTTDDSMEEEGADSRNSSLPREDWPDVHLPRVHTLAPSDRSPNAGWGVQHSRPNEI